MAYITTAMLEDRLSAAVVKRIYDDNNDGTSDTSPLARVVADAESRFESFCRGIYSLTALRASPPSEAVRLCLDVAEALACRRFPRAVNREWQELWGASTAELKSLRRGETRLDVEGTPEPGANQGGEYTVQGYDLDDEQPASYTHDGFGSF
jgi:phage gp36-like protein